MNLAPHPVTLRQLQYVVAIADKKSFRRAAEDCHVAQPSLSAQVAQVEEMIGVKLFERDHRTVSLTAAGEVFVARARALLVMADDLTESTRGLSDPLAGRLRLGIIPTIGPYFLGLAAPSLRRQFPKLAFVWAEEKTPVLIERLARGDLDGAILALEADVGELPHVVLGSDPFVLATAPTHALARKGTAVRPEELEGEHVLLLDDGHCFRDQVLSFCSRAGLEEASYRATSLPTLVQMAAGGAGITVLPSLAVDVENRHHALTIRPFAPKVPARTIALVWRKRSALEVALKAVGQALKESYAKIAAPSKPSATKRPSNERAAKSKR
jgi:LysR family hydrogen peroxide-inducible transcriptional activator